MMTERISSLFFHKNRHSLCPHRFAELIYAAGFFQAVACLEECFCVTGKTGRLAGNIYNTIHSVGKDLRECFRVDSIARRVKYDHIRLLGQIIQHL